MTGVALTGEFPAVALGLTLSLGCALVLAFLVLRFVIGLVTREQYNVTDDPRRVRAVVWMGQRGNRAGAESGGSRGATGGPYLLAAAAPPNRFARNKKLIAGRASRFIQLPQRSRSGAAQSRPSDDGHAA